MWLANIINNGTLVDNQAYQVKQGILRNRRLGEIALNTRLKHHKIHAYNNESAIWDFLHWVAADVKKMLHNNNALVLFNENYEHNTNSFISVNGTDAKNFNLHTGNLLGFVKRGDYALKINSRFGDAFLKYIIADADGFLERQNIGGDSHGAGYEWLLAYLWNIKFKKAYRLGLPKTYITTNNRLTRVRGTIDVLDYFQNQTLGKYQCAYREHSYASPAAALFIKAYEAVGHYSFCAATRHIYTAFLSANQGVKSTRQQILRTPYFSNPFYNDYNLLIDLSKQVISQQGADFATAHNSSAFFFDVAMLFEYFIRKLISRAGICLRAKSAPAYAIPAGALGNYQRKLKPDLVVESAGGSFVFDVKYKTFDKNYGVEREDLFQLHTYIGQYGNDYSLKGCGFIYPLSAQKWALYKLDATQGLIADVINQQGQKIPFYIIFLKIPDNKSHDFNQQMSEQCRLFIETIKKKILN